MKMVVIYCGGHFLVPETSSDTLIQPCLEPQRRLKTAGNAGLGESLLLYPSPGGLRSCTKEGGYLTGYREEFKLMPELETKGKVD